MIHINGDGSLIRTESGLTLMRAAVALLAILAADDSIGIGVIDDPLIGPVVAYIAKVAPSLYQFFVDLAPKLATCGG